MRIDYINPQAPVPDIYVEALFQAKRDDYTRSDVVAARKKRDCKIRFRGRCII